MQTKVKIMGYEDNFKKYQEEGDRDLILYGAGHDGAFLLAGLANVKYVCDKNADKIKNFQGIEVISPEQLEELSRPLLILIAIESERIRDQVHKHLQTLDIDALIFDARNNIAFNYYQSKVAKENALFKGKKLKKVRIVCRDKGWILRKYADKLVENLHQMNIEADIDDYPDLNADINYYYTYAEYEPLYDHTCDVLYITHIISQDKLEQLKFALETARIGICMSKDVMDFLVMNGIPKHKVCYINPAHDAIIKPKKYVLGITHRNHEDNRKRNTCLLDIMQGVDPDYFKIVIMGDRWEQIVDSLREQNFEVDYYPEFDLEIYTRLMPTLDLYMFYGWDEAGCGFMDAMYAGIDTIVTPVGYHLDTSVPPTYLCRTVDDFRDVLLTLKNKREKIRSSVEKWSWENYAKKHVEVWKYLLGDEEGIYSQKHNYMDGIYSVYWEQNEGRI
ncbi:MAG: hypothetical protein HFI70_01850 [Lachnospiraceae bacterium]|nr:hypothetical protein [Lachnospiraceae bacterium]